MVEVVVVDDKGRIVIPGRVRRKLGLSSGSRLLLVELDDNVIVLRKIDVRRILEAIAREVREKGLEVRLLKSH